MNPQCSFHLEKLLHIPTTKPFNNLNNNSIKIPSTQNFSLILILFLHRLVYLSYYNPNTNNTSGHFFSFFIKIKYFCSLNSMKRFQPLNLLHHSFVLFFIERGILIRLRRKTSQQKHKMCEAVLKITMGSHGIVQFLFVIYPHRFEIRTV